MKLKIVEFINSHDNWEEILSSSPYNLIIKHKEPFLLLKYNQLSSDMSIDMVQEARGLILKKEEEYKVASMRFKKFFNYGEDNAVLLDFDEPVALYQKIDGSLLSVFYDEDTGWHISTSGNIDAFDAPLQFQTNELKTYEDLFKNAINFKFEDLNTQFTYIFELISPYNRIVVPYKENTVYLLTIRDNNTLEECDYSTLKELSDKLNCKIPNRMDCYDIQDAINITSQLNKNDKHFEGFVLKDCHNNRIKLKSFDYMELFHIKGEGVFGNKKILQLILDEKDDDILANFPEYKDDFNNVRIRLNAYLEVIREDLNTGLTKCIIDKKTFAEWAKTAKNPNILFKMYERKSWNENWLIDQIKNISIDKLLIDIGLKERK